MNIQTCYKFGKLNIKKQDEDKIEQKIKESYNRGRLIPINILKYWKIEESLEASDAEKCIENFIRGHKLNYDKKCELFNTEKYNGDINNFIDKLNSHLLDASYI